MQVKITQVVFPVCLSCMSEFDQIHISTDVKRVWISTQLPSSKHVPAVVHGQVCYATCTQLVQVQINLCTGSVHSGSAK